MTIGPLSFAGFGPGTSGLANRAIRSPSYRYLVTDLLTDRLIGTLPLDDVSFSRFISRPGTIRGSWKVTSKAEAEIARVIVEFTGRCAIWAYRNGVIWWGGNLWTAVPKESSRSGIAINIGGATFDSYANRRVISDTIVYDADDYGFAITDLYNRMQAEDYSDIGVVVPAAPVIGANATYTFRPEELASYGKCIQTLGDAVNGPEHTIDVFEGPGGARVKQLRIETKLGSTVTNPRIVAGSKIPDWVKTHDATLGGTAFRARGDAKKANTGEQQLPLLSDVFLAQDLLDDGWPLLDVTDDFPNISTLAELNAQAEGMYLARKGKRSVNEYDIYMDDDEWHPNQIGESMVVRFSNNDLWRPGERDLIRPVGVEITAPSRGKEEKIKLVTEEVTV